MARKLPETQRSQPDRALSTDVEDWIRRFIKVLELHLVDANYAGSPDAVDAEMPLATARAIVATFLDSGMEFESVVELFGRVAVERQSRDVPWTDALNRRRFALIDMDIQGTLTPAGTLELAGLTRILRDHVESEINLPMAGARALHEKLLQLKSTGQSD